MAGLQVKEGYSGLTAAVSLAVAILKKSRSNTWDELLAGMAGQEPAVMKAFASLELTNSQLDLLGSYVPVLRMISIKPVTVPAICPECGLYILMSTGTVPSKCLVTAGCTGKPVKPAAAIASKDPAPEPEAVPADEAVKEAAPAPPSPARSVPAAAQETEDFDLSDLELPPAPKPVQVNIYDDDIFG